MCKGKITFLFYVAILMSTIRLFSSFADFNEMAHKEQIGMSIQCIRKKRLDEAEKMLKMIIIHNNREAARLTPISDLSSFAQCMNRLDAVEDARGKNKYAYYWMGVIKEKKHDIEGALKYHNLAAAQGYLKAENQLGMIWYKKKNLVRAIFHFRLAAERGFMKALNNLALLHEERNHTESAKNIILMLLKKILPLLLLL